MKDFEVTVRLKNNRLKARRTQLGMTARDFAAAAGVVYASYLSLENLKEYPAYQKDSARGREFKAGDWRPIAKKIAAFHGCSPYELFPDAVNRVQRSEIVAEFSLEQLPEAVIENIPQLLPSPEDAAILNQQKERVRELLNGLTPREADLIRRRFGIGCKEETLEEIGMSGVVLDDGGSVLQKKHPTKEAIRITEVRALKKLRRLSKPGGKMEVYE
jgi:transcriptional regulator with XRE-family HTH domain